MDIITVGFEWVKPTDRQLQFNHNVVENDYEEMKPMERRGFEWVKESDRQYKYNYNLHEENIYSPLPQSDSMGFEWITHSDRQRSFDRRLIDNRSFVFYKGQYISYENRKWNVIAYGTPNLEMFKTIGLNDLSFLDRRVQEVMYSPQKLSREEELEDGVVLKTTVSLEKYFDLRELDLKT